MLKNRKPILTLFKFADIMPHFIIDCSEGITQLKKPMEIIQEVYNTAHETGLFAKGDIKVRLNPFKNYIVGGETSDFIHVFSYIMEGRNTVQKSNLSRQIVTKLNGMFPEVPVISVNIKDFEKASYCNKSMV